MINGVEMKNIGLKVGIVLMLIFAIALASMIYVFFCVDFTDSNGDWVIDYNKLKFIMADNVFYLSQDFAIDNNLEIKPIYENGRYDRDKNIYLYGAGVACLGEVVLEYDENKVDKDTINEMKKQGYSFSKHVKNIDLYRYELVSASIIDGIPVRVSIVGAQGVNKKHKYDQSFGDVKYAILDKELTTYYTGKGKSYEIKGQVGKSGLIKKYARLKITVTVDAEIAPNYSSESIEERVDALLAASLNYVEFFA